MIRWFWLFLPICLILQDQRSQIAENRDLQDVVDEKVEVKQQVLEGIPLKRQLLLGSLAISPNQGFPCSLPWGPMHEIGKNDLYPVDYLLYYHPVEFLQMCVDRYEREVEGYSAEFYKREQIKGKLQPLEILDVHFREKPFSVYMKWTTGARLAASALYVKGENKNKLLARGKGILSPLGVFEKDVDAPDAKNSGRYTIDHFGIHLGTKRTIASMHKAQERGALHVEYMGEFRVPELRDKDYDPICYKFVRKPYEPPEEEDVNEMTIYIDQKTWLQVGSVLRDSKGDLIAEYFFRNIKLNPQFHKDQFTRAALK